MDQFSYFKCLFLLARKFKQSGFFGTRSVWILGCDSQDQTFCNRFEILILTQLYNFENETYFTKKKFCFTMFITASRRVFLFSSIQYDDLLEDYSVGGLCSSLGFLTKRTRTLFVLFRQQFILQKLLIATLPLN